MKKTKRTKLLKQVNVFDKLLSALFGVLFTAIFQALINKSPKIFQEFYNKLLYHSITLNIVIVLILLTVFLVLIFRHTKKNTALIVLFIISFVVALEGFGIYQMWKIRDKSLVIIAKFENSSQVSVDIDGRIYEQLLSDKKSNSNLNSLIIERIPTVIKNEEEAKRESENGIWRNVKIIIVVWGMNDDIGGTTYFDVVKAPKKELITKIPIEKEMSTIEEIRNLNFSYYKETLPDAVKFLSYFTFGLSHYFANDYTGAIYYFNESLNKFPRDGKIDEYLVSVYFYMGTCYYLKNDLIEAENKYREAIRINPSQLATHNNLGALLYKLHRYEEAEKEFREAIRINPSQLATRSNLGALLADLQRYEEAEEEFREVIRINPNDNVAHYNLGTLLYNLHCYVEAEKEYREAIRINPDYADAHYNLGILLSNLNRYVEAEKEYREAVRINPSLYGYEAHANLGFILGMLHRYEEAEKESREAIKINPDRIEAHNNLGISLTYLHRYEEAEKEYREAIRINQDYADAHYNLGALLLIKGSKIEAKQEILKGRELFEKQGNIDGVKKCDELLKGL